MDNSIEIASLNAKKRASGVNPTSRAFTIEALILLAFLAVSVAIILQLFATAGIQSREAHKLSMSEHLATNAAESFGANPAAAAGTLYFDEEGMPLDEAKGAVFSVDTEVTSYQTQSGTMYEAAITVTNYQARVDGNVIYELDTARYLSASEGGAQ